MLSKKATNLSGFFKTAINGKNIFKNNILKLKEKYCHYFSFNVDNNCLQI